ncbi:HNH endonuclease [Novosphingobium sp. MW5]|nr:HNH endonuclease [Novosphingobium sp. MW5]
MKLLFAHISWMPEYSGKSSETIFSTHGWVVENNEAGERSNFKAVNGQTYGYVPVVQRPHGGDPGEIKIERLGAAKADKFVDDVTVIWFANKPIESKKAYVVGWYRNARVYRQSRSGGPYGYRVSCKHTDATLVPEHQRTVRVPHKRSIEGRELGFGYGQSSIWYADDATEEFVQGMTNYIDSFDRLNVDNDGFEGTQIGDAINDLDQPDIGNTKPKRGSYSANFIVRDDRVRKSVLKRAQGRCEHCGELGFKRPDGSHFVEAHHIISLAEQGPDTLDNVIALCPNHHREAHFGESWEQLESELKAKLAKLRGN